MIRRLFRRTRSPCRRSRPVLTSHSLIRFPPEAIAQVKGLAEQDQKSVSCWIRDVITAEIERRQGPREPKIKIHTPATFTATNSTATSWFADWDSPEDSAYDDK